MASKRERFVELAEKRVNRCIDLIQMISKLSNRSSYEYEKADYAQIMRALNKELRACKTRFEDAVNSKTKTAPEKVFKIKNP